jgi:hypothetical protein
VVVGSIAGSALVVIALAWLGPTGSAIVVATGVIALTASRPA